MGALYGMRAALYAGVIVQRMQVSLCAELHVQQRPTCSDDGPVQQGSNLSTHPRSGKR